MGNDGCTFKKVKIGHRETLLFMTVFLILAIGIILLYSGDLSSKVLPYVSYISNQDEEQMVHDFTSGMEIKQTFSCYQDFDLITLSFSDHDTVQHGKLQIQICDKEREEDLIFIEKDMVDIHYAEPVEISFEKVGGGKANRLYEVTLRSSDTKETAIGVFGYDTDTQGAYVNGKQGNLGLSIGIHGYTNSFRILTICVLLLAMLAVMAVILGTFEIKLSEQRIFLLLAIPFALCMLMMWPGNSVYDEARHYHTIYNYSNRLMGYGNSIDGTEIKMRRCDVLDNTVKKGLGTAANSQVQYWGYYVQSGEGGTDEDIILVDISSTPVVQNGTWIEYLPEIVGITLGRLLKWDYLWTGTLIRIANIVCYIALCYLAIYKTPTLKSLFVLLAALPMNLYQVSGISYDGTTFGIGIVVFAFIMKLWVEGLSKKEWIELIIFSILLGSCKGGVYLSLLLLMCFVPQNKYKNKLLQIGITWIFGAFSMLKSFVPVFMRWFGLGGNDSYIVNGVQTTGGNLHLLFAFKYPIEFIKMLVMTLITDTDMYMGQALGYRTAWANTTISIFVILPFLLLLLSAAIRDGERDFRVDPISRVGLAVLLLIEVIGMHAIFLIETPINSPIIVGCQGRYFILFIPCILLLFRNNGIVFKEKREYLYPLFSMAQLVYLYYFLELFMCA